MSNWKAPGPDNVHLYWIKHLSALHERIDSQLNMCLQTGNLYSAMTEGRTLLIEKGMKKPNYPVTSVQ